MIHTGDEWWRGFWYIENRSSADRSTKFEPSHQIQTTAAEFSWRKDTSHLLGVTFCEAPLGQFLIEISFQGQVPSLRRYHSTSDFLFSFTTNSHYVRSSSLEVLTWLPFLYTWESHRFSLLIFYKVSSFPDLNLSTAWASQPTIFLPLFSLSMITVPTSWSLSQLILIPTDHRTFRSAIGTSWPKWKSSPSGSSRPLSPQTPSWRFVNSVPLAERRQVLT